MLLEVNLFKKNQIVGKYAVVLVLTVENGKLVLPDRPGIGLELI